MDATRTFLKCDQCRITKRKCTGEYVFEAGGKCDQCTKSHQMCGPRILKSARSTADTGAGSVISEDEWESYKDLFKDYYIDQKMTLKDTTTRMKDHGIVATPRQWERRAEKWGFSKYTPRSERPIPSTWDLTKDGSSLAVNFPGHDRMQHFLRDSEHAWTEMRTTDGASDAVADQWSATHCQDAAGNPMSRPFKRGYLRQGHVYTVCSPFDASTHLRTFVVLASRERTWAALRVMRAGTDHVSSGLLQHQKRLVSTRRLELGARAAEETRFMIELADGQVLYHDTWIDLEESWNLAPSMNVMCCGRLTAKSFQQAVQQHTGSYLSAFKYLLPQRTPEPQECDQPIQ